MASELQLSSANTFSQEQSSEGGVHLDRLVLALKRHVLLIAGITSLTAAAAVFKAVTDTPTYQASFELLTPPVTLETQIISTLNPEALSSQSDVVDVAIDETKLKILTSPRVMEPIVDELQQRYPDLGYGEVVSNLRITPEDTGNTLTVQYQGDDPEQVLDVLDLISRAYLKYSLEDRQNDIYRGIDFVDEQLPIARQRVEALEEELEALRQRSNLIDPLMKGEQLSQQTAKFTGEQLDLRVQIEQAKKLYVNLQQELQEGEELATTSTLSDSQRYQRLLDQLLEIDAQLAEELTLYLPSSPEIEVLQEQRENLQPLLAREGYRVQEQLSNYIRELQDRDQALSNTIESLNRRTKGLSTVAREYNNIQRELEIATANLNQFLTKREALRIDAAQRQTPWEILTPPSTPRASAASARRNLFLGTALGLLLGSGVAILVDRISGKIHTIKDLKDVTPVPLLGTIPYNHLLEEGDTLAVSMNQLGAMGFGMPTESKNSGAVEHNTRLTPFLESFRLLYTSIELSSPDERVQSFTISSAIPNSGKSTISFHLAHTAASMGKRVLLVDADLRRPTLHRLCNTSNQRGVSNYTTGEFNLEDVIIDLPLEKNLFFLPSGPIPPDPSKILSAHRMNHLFEYGNKEFDLVIFDTPPLLGFADAYMIVPRTQGMLMTSRLGELKYSELQEAFDDLRTAKITILGMVANGSKQESETSYRYYYYQQPAEVSEEALDKPNGSEAIESTFWHRNSKQK